jgi:uncharacterized protein YcbX
VTAAPGSQDDDSVASRRGAPAGTSSLLATVTGIHRYPVKSMAGEPLEACLLCERGIPGDRAFALFDPDVRTIASAKSVSEFPGLMDFGASYHHGVEGEAPGELRVRMPDGRSFRADDPACEGAISAWFGRRIELGKVTDPPERRPRGRKYTMEGTFFDYAPLHLLTARSMASFARAAPGSVVEVPRFRPNLMLACDAAAPYPENEWVGKTLRLGAEVLIEVTDPCPRCAMITLAQRDMPKDPGLLKALTRANSLHVPVLGQQQPSLGAYAFVRRGGIVRIGDALSSA